MEARVGFSRPERFAQCIGVLCIPSMWIFLLVMVFWKRNGNHGQISQISEPWGFVHVSLKSILFVHGLEVSFCQDLFNFNSSVSNNKSPLLIPIYPCEEPKCKHKQKVWTFFHSGNTNAVYYTKLGCNQVAFLKESMLWFDSIFCLKFVRERERFL